MEQRIPDQQSRTNKDGRVGNIKRGVKVLPLPVQRNKIDHMAEQQPIDQVTERAANNQHQRNIELPSRAGGCDTTNAADRPTPPAQSN